MPYDYSCTFNIKTLVSLFQTEINRLTRSGFYFMPKELRKAKGKEVTVFDKELEVNKPVVEKESNDFLKLIKYSEYYIVDQLKETLSRIFLMSLILNSKTYQNAL